MSAWLPQVDGSVVFDGLISLLLLFFLIVRVLIVQAISKNPTLSMKRNVDGSLFAIAWCLGCLWGWSSYGARTPSLCRVSRSTRSGARVGDHRSPALVGAGGATGGRESLLGG